MKQILVTYEEASGQSINFTKFGVFFNSNLGDELKHGISSIFNVFNTLDTVRCLGLPSMIGKKKKLIFSRNSTQYLKY